MAAPPPYPSDYAISGPGMEERPPPYNPMPPTAPQSSPDMCLPILTEEDIREALAQFVSEHCCYSPAPLRDIVIRSIEPATTYHFRLESFMEKRTTATVEEPYDGSCIDGAGCGPVPDIWIIPIYHAPFQDGEKRAVLPHTAKLLACSDCAGMGRKPCHHCSGRGRHNCTTCAAGSITEDRCHSCHGTGETLCRHCNGVGQKLCGRCQGHGRLKSYLCVKSVAKTYIADSVIATERSVPSDIIIKSASGATVYRDEGPAVVPIANFPDRRVIQASNHAVADSFGSHHQERMLRQRQVVNAVPVTEVICAYKHEIATFYVYGLNNKVYFPGYFSQCCGCCTIL